MKKYFVIIFIIFFTGCGESFLEENIKSDITEENFFGKNTSELAVEQYINAIYQSNIWAIWDVRWQWFSEVPADCFNHTLTFDAEGQEYDNHNFNADQYNIYRQWAYLWWPIARANLFMDKYDFLEENYGNKWTRLKWFKGQALFFRGYNYFMGVQMWGPIPVVLDVPNGSNYTNSTVPEVYNQAISDLKEIVDNNLCPEFSQIQAKDLGRITMGAAKSLLAKVYLTRSYTEFAEPSDVQNAITYAKDVVENSGYGLVTEPDIDGNGDTIYTAYEKPFLPQYKNSIEGIWEYQFLKGAGTSKLNEEYAPPGYYGTWGKARFEATPLLYNSFESGDIRKKVYITGEVVSPATGKTLKLGDKIYMVKYHDPDYTHTAGNLENNFLFIRFADMLLIYAEALNKHNNGPTQAAFDAINRVRTRAGLPDLIGNYTFNSFLKAVQDERFKELAGEGQRLYDLRRWGYNTLKERVELSNPRASVEPHEVLWPIPSYELNMNPEINQNPGY